MAEFIQLLWPYVSAVLPGVGLMLLVLLLTPRHWLWWRVVIYLLVFILVRDAMTPVGLWRVGSGPGGFWIRLVPDARALVALGLSSVGLVLGMQALDPDLARLCVWRRGPRWRGILVGLVAGLLIAAPLLAWHTQVPIAERGGSFDPRLLWASLIFALGGNLYEEVLFRGYVQGLAEREGLTSGRAALYSGLLFGAGHAFLATTVTSVGWPLLLFATGEGLVCGWLRWRHGLLSAVLAHGTAIFWLTSGLV